MDNSTPQHDESEVSAEATGPASPVPAFRLSFVIPEFKFKGGDNKLKRQVRAVLGEALKQTEQKIQDGPLGYRVHVQFSTKDFTEAQHAAARTGRMMPPCTQTEIAAMFGDAPVGIAVTKPGRIVQLLTTVGWGEQDAVQVSIWALDFERKDGVQ